MEIAIKSDKVTTERTSKGMLLHKQQAAMNVGKDYPLVFDLTVGKADEAPKPYPAGNYDLDPGAFRVSRFGSLELDPYAIKLVPKGK